MKIKFLSAEGSFGKYRKCKHNCKLHEYFQLLIKWYEDVDKDQGVHR